MAEIQTEDSCDRSLVNSVEGIRTELLDVSD